MQVVPNSNRTSQSTPRICLHQIGEECWKWSFDASKSMKIDWRLCCCVWAWVLGSLEFVQSTLSQFKSESIQFLKRKSVFQSKWKTTCWFIVLILCFSLSVFERFLNWFALGWLNCQTNSISWFDNSTGWYLKIFNNFS